MNKFKKYFIEKPKGNPWKKATYYLILLKYVGPVALVFIMPLLAGLLMPNQSVDFLEAGQRIGNVYAEGMQRLYDAGSNISNNNPITSKVLAFALSNFIWVIYLGIFSLILTLIRYLTSWIYNRTKSNGGQKHGRTIQ